jgi:SOS response regulatory protein OraA/RecX
VYKIRTALRRKGINEQIINEAIKQIPTEKSAEQLQQKLERKIKSIKYENAFQLRNKLMRYALSLGYPMQSVIERVEELMQNLNIKEECDDIFF